MSILHWSLCMARPSCFVASHRASHCADKERKIHVRKKKMQKSEGLRLVVWYIVREAEWFRRGGVCHRNSRNSKNCF